MREQVREPERELVLESELELRGREQEMVQAEQKHERERKREQEMERTRKMLKRLRKRRAEVRRRLRELTELEEGWDGYNGKPVSQENAAYALKLLDRICQEDTPAPQIVPGPGGDLQIEWHAHGGDLEIEIAAPDGMWFSTGRHECLPLPQEFDLLVECVRKLGEESEKENVENTD